MIRRTILAVVALAAFAPQIRAQAILDFWTQCTPGLLRACVTTSIWNEVVGTETYFMVQISNVQGTPGFTDLPQAGLHAFWINDLSVSGIPALFSGQNAFPGQWGIMTGNASFCSFGGVCSDAGVGDSPVLDRMADGTWRMEVALTSGQAMWGCDPNFSGGGGRLSTCGGSVIWRIRPTSFLTPGQPTFSLTPNAQTSVTYTYDTGGLFGTACTTGVDCVTVTPEPATIILLAGGLLGIGVVMRRRRKLEN